MKIAVTYENEEIFQHFGHCEAFKLYETEDGKVVSSQVVGTGGSGHEALAVFLKNLDVEVLICGGIGGGLSFFHISEPTRLKRIPFTGFCL